VPAIAEFMDIWGGANNVGRCRLRQVAPHGQRLVLITDCVQDVLPRKNGGPNSKVIVEFRSTTQAQAPHVAGAQGQSGQLID
jgi:hypothetical protein